MTLLHYRIWALLRRQEIERTRVPMGHLLFCLALLMPLSSIAHSAEPLKGVIAGHVPPSTVWYDQWLVRKASLDADPSDIRLEFFIHGELGNDDAVLSALRRGRVSIAGPSLTGLAGLIPETAVISLPYLFETPSDADAFFKCCARNLFEPLFEEKGLIFLGWSEAGWKSVYANKPVILPADAEPLRFRSPAALTSTVFVQELGADAVFIGLNDIVPSLETGMIDGGLATVPFYWGTVSKIAPHYTVTAHAYEVAPFLANANWWQGAAPEQQAALRGAFDRYGDEAEAVRAFDKDLLGKLRADDRVTIHDLGAERREEWIKIGRASHERALQKIGGRARQVYESILSAQNKD